MRILAGRMKRGEEMGAARITSCLMRVSDLDRSANFYCYVFECHIAIHEPEAALLLTPGGFQIYLRTRQAGRARGINDVGVEEIIWSVDNEEELQRIEQRLRTRYPSTYSNTLNGVSFVDGVDPDGTRVLVTYPTPEQFPCEVIDRRFR
ncbi:VOC family protein [Nocardia sp. NPDC059246]|uniref:VOC family protein n=1 Tax=unclassified Nocardia TaxID=2637762 RepID=UPI0036AD674B